MGLPARVTVSPDVVSTEMGGRIMLLNLENETYYSLDDVGSRMWALMNEESEIPALLAALLAEYEVGEEQLREDLGALIERLEEAALVSTES